MACDAKLSLEPTLECVCVWLHPHLNWHHTKAHSCILNHNKYIPQVSGYPISLFVRTFLLISSMEIKARDFIQHIDSPFKGGLHTSWKDQHITWDTSSMSRRNLQKMMLGYLTSRQSIGWIYQQAVAALADCTLSPTHNQSGNCAASVEWDTKLGVTTRAIDSLGINTTFTTNTVTDRIPNDLCCVADLRHGSYLPPLALN